MATLTRRALLGGALGGGVLTAAGCGASGVGRASAARGATLTSGTLTSRHWRGRDIRWRVAVPADGDDGASPLVVVLHGKGGDASHAFGQLHLDDHVAKLRLAVASVDGGDTYWHARRSGVDAGAMVVEDFLPLVLGRVGRPPDEPVGFLGWSMGGYGSLLLGSELGPERVAGVVAESAALWTDPGRSAAGAFDDREDFVAHDVFAKRRLDVLAGIPVRLDCGRSDPFVEANRTLAKALPTARLTVDDGDHSTRYWRDHGRDQLRWLSEQLRRQ